MKSDHPAKEVHGVHSGTRSSGWEGGRQPAPILVASVLSRFLEQALWVEMSVPMVYIKPNITDACLSLVKASTEIGLVAQRKHFKKE